MIVLSALLLAGCGGPAPVLEPYEEYSYKNPELKVEFSSFTGDEGEMVETKTCSCRGCHWKCEQ